MKIIIVILILISFFIIGKTHANTCDNIVGFEKMRIQANAIARKVAKKNLELLVYKPSLRGTPEYKNIFDEVERMLASIKKNSKQEHESCYKISLAELEQLHKEL